MSPGPTGPTPGGSRRSPRPGGSPRPRPARRLRRRMAGGRSSRPPASTPTASIPGTGVPAQELGDLDLREEPVLDHLEAVEVGAPRRRRLVGAHGGLGPRRTPPPARGGGALLWPRAPSSSSTAWPPRAGTPADAPPEADIVQARPYRPATWPHLLDHSASRPRSPPGPTDGDYLVVARRAGATVRGPVTPKVAFVTPRYGPEVMGGAETAARQLAEHLTADCGWSRRGLHHLRPRPHHLGRRPAPGRQRPQRRDRPPLPVGLGSGPRVLRDRRPPAAGAGPGQSSTRPAAGSSATGR